MGSFPRSDFVSSISMSTLKVNPMIEVAHTVASEVKKPYVAQQV